MGVLVKDVAVEDNEPYDLVTKLRMCRGCLTDYRSLSPLEKIEQLMRLREEALVEMHRLAAELLTAEAVDIHAHTPNGEPPAPR